LLQQTLDEEKQTDEKLTQIAVKQINLEAAKQGEASFPEKAQAKKRSTAKAQAKR
jgi:hypothetical protein